MEKKARIRFFAVLFLFLLVSFSLFVFAGDGVEMIKEKKIIKRTFTSDTIDNGDGTYSLTMYPYVKYFDEIVNLTETSDGFILKWYDKEVKIINKLKDKDNKEYKLKDEISKTLGAKEQKIIKKKSKSYEFGINITGLGAKSNYIKNIIMEFESNENLTIKDGILYLPDGLIITFDDLKSKGFSIDSLKKVGKNVKLEIGNVQGRTNLLIDPTVTHTGSSDWVGTFNQTEINGENISLKVRDDIEYTGTSYPISEDISLQDLFWDGSYWWVVGDNTDKVYKYYPNWTYTGTSYDISSEDSTPYAIEKNSSNFFMGGVYHDAIYEYSTSWTYSGNSFSVGSQDSFLKGIHWDGSYWWVVGDNTDKVYKYYPNWTYTGTSYDISSEDSTPEGIFKENYWWLLGSSNDKVYKYYPNWTYTGTSYDISSEDGLASGLYSNGSRLFILGNGLNKIFEYYFYIDSYYFSGDYISQVIDAGRDVSWDNLSWDEYEPNANVNISFQVRSCDDASCSGETFVGPDNTSSTYFTSSPATLNTTITPDNQYFQYKATFQTNNITDYTPQLSEVRIGYSNIINVISPTNGQIFTEDSPTSRFNITTLKDMDTCIWSENGINYSLNKQNSTYFYLVNTTMVDGFHKIKYLCNFTTGGWIDSEEISFNVDSANITKCRNLTVSRNYLLLNNVTSALGEACFKFFNSNLIFDGNYNSIFVNSFGSVAYGIDTGAYNKPTIKNLYIFKKNSSSTESRGIFLNSLSSNLTNIHIETEDIGLLVNNDDCYFNNLTITSENNYAILEKGNNNSYHNINISGGGFNYIYINPAISNSNISIYDSILSSTSTYSIKTYSPSYSINVNLFNVSYNGSESIDSDSKLYRKWHFETKVNSSEGGYLQDANVSFYDNEWNLLSSKLTNSTGDVGVEEITEYLNNGGIIKYYTPHHINISKSGYYTNHTSYNLTTSKNVVHIVILEKVDTTPPSLSIVHPSNNQNFSYKDVDVNYTVSDNNLQACWYSNDSGQTNHTITCGQNLTSINWDEGSNTVYIYANDSLGNENSTSVTFTVDTTPPTSTATATSPPDSSSYTFNTWTKNDVKVTISAYDSGVGYDNTAYPKYCTDQSNTCTPTTFISSGTTISTEGISYIRYYSEDLLGNTETTQSKTIKIDKTPPSVSILYPTSNLYFDYNTSINLNFSVSDSGSGISTCWYNLDNGTNTTISCNSNTTFDASEGTHTLYFFSNDSLNNVNNSESVTFTIDLTKPSPIIVYPTNTTYNTNVSELNYTFTEANPDSCWYSIDNGVTNSSIVSCGTNFTNVQSSEGSNTWTLYMNDSAGNFNSTSVTFFKDTIIPQISYNPSSDSNATWSTTGTFFINITASDTNKDTVMWEFDGTNETFENSSGDYYWETKTGLSTGSYFYYAWINDTAGNLNKTPTRVIYVDREDPNVTIVSPTSKNYNTNVSIPLNYTALDTNLQSCWWNIDGGSNNSITCGQNTTFNTSEGDHTIYVYANDSSGREGSDSVSFTVNLAPPSISLDFPTHNSWLDYLNIQFNYTPSDTSLDTCELWINSTGTWHKNQSDTSPTSDVTNTFDLTLQDGYYIWNIWCNDTGNNYAWGDPTKNYTLNIDSTTPLISYGIGTPANDTNTTSTSIYVNVSVTETNENNIKFVLFNSIGSYNITTFTDGTREINWTNLPDDTYYFNVTITDDAGNSNSTETRTIRLDDTKPSITIYEPKAQNYNTNNSMQLNYTATDNLIGLDECWYYVYNSSGSLIITTTTLSNCENTTFSLPGGDIDYTLYLFSKDKLGNTNSKSVTFGIRTESPAISLGILNDTHSNTLYNHIFNFTVSTNADSISSCQLWGNWTTGWHKNQTLTSVSTSSVNNFNAINLSEGKYLWNVWCNDSLNNDGWGLNNQTFVVDITYPTIEITSITTTTGTQTFKFETNATDLNPITCKYSIYDSSGNIDGLNENVSFTCNQETSATTTAYGTFNLTVYVSDKAGNENSTTSSFTVSAAAPAGGGGGTIPSALLFFTVALIQPDNVSANYNDLQKSIIFAQFNNFCKDKVSRAFSVINYYQKCTLDAKELEKIRKNLEGFNVYIKEGEMIEWYRQYKLNRIYQTKSKKSDIEKYDLLMAIIENPLILTPSRIDYTFLAKETLEYTVRANKPVQSCEVSSPTPNLFCRVLTNTTVGVYYNLTDFNFISKLFSGQVGITAKDERGLETRYVDFIARTYNLNYKSKYTLNLPLWMALIIYSLVFVFVFFSITKLKLLKRVKIK